MSTFQVLRSRRRTLGLEVCRDGRVLVRAPLEVPDGVIQDFVARHTQWIKTHQARMQERQTLHPEPTPSEQAALVRKAQALLPGKVAHFAAQMGVRPTGITITGARTRFGSCSPKNRLCFSWRLMQYPDAAIDYVVVHELAHIRHKNHGPDFHAFVAAILPDHKERRKLLRC